jgi:hypothetical protein
MREKAIGNRQSVVRWGGATGKRYLSNTTTDY